MKVVSVNIGKPKTVSWRGKVIQTGIYKNPVNEPIYLDIEDVQNDHVIDRRYHGGVDKACYLYAANHYAYWKEKYPNLPWNYGMFGENLTVDGFDENTIKIGSIYTLGEAKVQISRPRQPCYKLGIRFGDQSIIKQFVDSLLSGVYVRVLKPGHVKVNDEFILTEKNAYGISITELNTLLFHFDGSKHIALSKKAIEDPLVSDSDKKYFRNKIEK